MAKYLNKSARVHIVGGKVLIPLAEAVELTDEELKSSVLQAYIAKGDLVKVDEPDAVDESAAEEVPAEVIELTEPAEAEAKKPRKQR